MTQQARNFIMQVEEQGLAATHLIWNMDCKFQGGSDGVLAAEGVKAMPVGLRKPNLNAYAERFAQSLQAECLDHFVVQGSKHLDPLVAEYLEHYHLERPHQGIGNQLVIETEPPGRSPPESEIACHERLGGLLRHYYRRAA